MEESKAPELRDGTSRRSFLRVAGVAAAGVAAAAACAPAAAPSGGGPAAAPATAKREPWQDEWERLAEAAKKEGKLAVHTNTGTGYRQALDAFGAQFGLEITHVPEASASTWIPKMQAERAAGIYTFDVFTTPPNSALAQVKTVWDPIRPILFRPDVLNDKAWRSGSADGQYLDVEKSLAFSWDFSVNRYLIVDTNQVKQDEIKTVRDLLDPKWRGKMIIIDHRVGPTWLASTALRLSFPNDAEEIIRRLYVEQQPAFTRDSRLLAEAVVRGRNPIALGVSTASLTEFKANGLGGNLKFIDLPEWDIVYGYCVFLCNKAPHPNAAKLFVNWLLSQEGQAAWCKSVEFNSARTDVPVYSKDSEATPGKQYYFAGQEATYAKQQETQAMLAKLLG